MVQVIIDEEKKDQEPLGCIGHGHGGSKQGNFKEVLKYCFTNSFPMYVNVCYNTNTSVVFVSISSYSPISICSNSEDKWASTSYFT